MSHDHSRRDSCLHTMCIWFLHSRFSFDSTRRDGCGRWLWRLVSPFSFSCASGIEMIDTICNAANFPLLASKPDTLLFSLTSTTVQKQRLLSLRKVGQRPIEPKRTNLPCKPIPVLVCGVDSPMRAANFASQEFAPILSGHDLRNRPNRSREAPPRRVVIIFRQMGALAAHAFLANVKDEPRPQLARRVPHHDYNSIASFLLHFYSTRRDSCGRWLWRLVSPFFE
jgi:hypothetical protein